MNRRFQAKLAKSKNAYYQNYCTNSTQTLHNDKDHQMPFVDGPNMRIINSRWRTAAIVKNVKFQKSKMAAAAMLKMEKNRHISAAVWSIRPNLALRRNSTLLSRPTAKNFKCEKSNMAAVAILKKIVKSPYLCDGWTYRHEIWHADAVWPSWPFRFENRPQ